MMWVLLLVCAAALGLGALFYLATRVRRFSFLRELAIKNRALSWLLAAALVSLLFLFAFINVYAVVIVVLHLALFWLLCDLAAWIVQRIRKTEPKRYLAGAIAVLLTAVYLGAGWIAAHQIRQTRYTVATEKTTEPLRIVLLSDAHLGITLDGDGFAKRWNRSKRPNPILWSSAAIS